MPEGDQIAQVSSFPDIGGDAAKGREFYKSMPDAMRAYADRNREPPIGQKPSKESTVAEPAIKAEPASTSLAEPAQAKAADEAAPTEKPEGESAEKEAKAEPTEKEGEEPAPFAIDDIAEALGVEADKIGDRIIVTVKGEDGKPEKVTLAELIKGQLRDADYRHKTMQHAEKVKAWEADTAKRGQEMQQKLNGLATVHAVLQGKLYAGLPSKEEYQQLQARVAADVNDYDAREKLTAITATFGARQRELQMAQQHLDQAVQERQDDLLRITNEGKQKLRELIPDLKDDAKGKAFASDMTLYLKDVGYGDGEIEAGFFSKNAVYDYRHVLVVRDAMRWRQAQKKSADLKKVTDALPKLILKPGAGGGKPVNKAVTNLDSLRERFGRTRSVEDYAALSDAKRAAAGK